MTIVRTHPRSLDYILLQFLLYILCFSGLFVAACFITGKSITSGRIAILTGYQLINFLNLLREVRISEITLNDVTKEVVITARSYTSGKRVRYLSFDSLRFDIRFRKSRPVTIYLLKNNYEYGYISVRKDGFTSEQLTLLLEKTKEASIPGNYK